MKFETLRGNVDTRISKMKSEGFDAIVLASAGVKRMGQEELITERLPYKICLPAVGQGAIGVEVRAENDELLEILKEYVNLEESKRLYLSKIKSE